MTKQVETEMKKYCPCCGSQAYPQTPGIFWCPECDSTHISDEFETINKNTLNLIFTDEVKE